MNHHSQSPTKNVILIIEDEPSIRTLLHLAITEEWPQARVIEAASGQSAVSIAQTIKCDLFIIDYLLDGPTGIEVYDWLRALPAYQYTPALFITATAHKEPLQQRQFLVLEKPFNIDEFLALVRKMLSPPPTEPRPNS